MKNSSKRVQSQTGLNSAERENFRLQGKVKKYIEIPEEILIRLSEGLSVQGGLQRDRHTGRLVFTAHDLTRYREGYHRPPEKLIRELEHGRVTETPKRIKVYESIPKKIGTARNMNVLDREMKEAKTALIDREIIENV